MKGNRIASIVVVMATLHIVVLNIVFGLGHIGYILTATLQFLIADSIGRNAP
jgi:hypothetical protein